MLESAPKAIRSLQIQLLEADEATLEPDPADLVLTCANCGARMDERRCTLVCRCGYFASCSDYY